MLLLTAAVCLAIAAAPLAHSPWLYLGFSFICHQQPERSLLLAGLPLAVCARCTGIYLGAFLAILLRFPSRRAAILTAAGLLVMDWVTEAAGLRPAWTPLRVATGAVMGMACAPVLQEVGGKLGA